MMEQMYLEAYHEGKCGKCGRDFVMPSGPPLAPILLIGPEPDEEELEYLSPFIGEAGSVLKSELMEAGVDLNICRATNLWLHEETKECDIGLHMDLLIYELKNQQPKAVLIMGAYPVSTFFRMNVSDISGLRLRANFMPPSVRLTMPMFSPAIALKGGIGEVRFAIKNFKRELEKEGVV